MIYAFLNSSYFFKSIGSLHKVLTLTMTSCSTSRCLSEEKIGNRNHKQKSIAEELDRTPVEVSKKLEDIRTRYAF